MSDAHATDLAKLIAPLRVSPGSKVDLERDFDPAFKPSGLSRELAEDELRLSVEMLSNYQDRLAAQGTHALLVVLQALDAGGKDGTIRHVMSGVNPQGVVVHSFKVPSAEELAHDFLWRYVKQLPARGQIGIFNRSHYEEVLVVRVHPELLERQGLPPEAREGRVWKRRFRMINEWEEYLVGSGIRIVKLLLNISREEQRRRFLKRIDLAEKNWKFSASDVYEREFWDQYQKAFSEMLTHTSTASAPWHVIPADRKWFARLAAGAVIVQALADIDPQYPVVDPAAEQELQKARRKLQAEAPPGAAADPFDQESDRA